MTTGVTGLGPTVVPLLEHHGISVAVYVADHLLTGITNEIQRHPSMELITAAREDEGLAILAGLVLGGRRGVMLMQSSGFGLCPNALASFLIPYQIPVPMLVGLRGDLGEFNVAQLAGGRAVSGICSALGISYEAPESVESVDVVFSGLLSTCFATQYPVCMGIRRSVAQ